MNNGVLTHYKDAGTEHILKFEIKCSTDKLEGLPKVPLEVVEEVVESPQISIPEMVVDTYKWKDYLSIGIIVFVGILILSLMKRKPKLSE